MEYVSLGNTGTKVSRICLGCMSFGNSSEWMIELEESRAVFSRAVDLGINFFDTANVYSRGRSEEILGNLLKGQREQAVIATKVHGRMWDNDPNGEGLSRKHIMHQIDASLKRLQTDRIDLYQIHRWDDETPIEETVAALHDIVRSGKARYIGASTMRAWQFAKAQHAAERAGQTRFIAMQNRYNLVNREEEHEMIPLCLDQGVGVLPYSPLARGLLTGKRGPSRSTARSSQDRRTYRDADLAIADVVRAIADEREVSAAQIALAWLMARPGVVAPIVGSTRLEHVTDAIAATALKLTEEECRRLEEPYVPHRYGEFT